MYLKVLAVAEAQELAQELVVTLQCLATLLQLKFMIV